MTYHFRQEHMLYFFSIVRPVLLQATFEIMCSSIGNVTTFKRILLWQSQTNHKLFFERYRSALVSSKSVDQKSCLRSDLEKSLSKWEQSHLTHFLLRYTNEFLQTRSTRLVPYYLCELSPQVAKKEWHLSSMVIDAHFDTTLLSAVYRSSWRTNAIPFWPMELSILLFSTCLADCERLDGRLARETHVALAV